ncbi:ATP-binding protein [Chloroflexi bacterium TSY]|nr:ATP-binding protein [Chloroflexi bacterium TSY]
MTPKSLQSRLKIAKNAKFGSTEPAKISLYIKDINSILSLLNSDQKAESKFWRSSNVQRTIDFELTGEFEKAKLFNFVPTAIAQSSHKEIQPSGEGIANLLARILFDNRDFFIELEERFIKLVPNISRIALDQDTNRQNLLRLVDRHSGYEIPASDVSDGSLRLLAFLAALYDKDSPDIICFEEPENGVHPWLLNKIMELLTLVSQEGVRGKPIQVLVTTHSPILLNYVQPEQIRAVELDNEGKTQVRPLPTDTVRFQKAMEAYDGELGELWFTNLFGGNPA